MANKQNNKSLSPMFYILGTIVILVALYGMLFWIIQTRDVSTYFDEKTIDGEQCLVYDESTIVYDLHIEIRGSKAYTTVVLKPFGIRKEKTLDYDPGTTEKALIRDVGPTLRLEALTLF